MFNGMAKYTTASPRARKMSLFSSIIIMNILSYAIIRICLLLPYSNFYKKQAFDFLKRNSYTNVCMKFLFDPKLITPLLNRHLISLKEMAIFKTRIWRMRRTWRTRRTRRIQRIWRIRILIRI